MPRLIYLAVFSNGLQPAHQAIFVPTGDTGEVGKVIHVTGNPTTGFCLQFKRNYNFLTDNRKYVTLPLGEVEDQCIKDTVGNGNEGMDTTARDQLESIALVVEPPKSNLDLSDPLALTCHDWILAFVQKLVDDGIVTERAISVVQDGPKIL
ncbi:hypothetical protein N7495_006632 [Penicillium taxi]|uniref:uncharacterized protein n=1 Tax=Penicillium taxi TaxID=168475 RepID=UPI0025454FEA|nr:uncharacterized protein N7495_006632 [Penicillium taxi]KAJ5894941.1 hypothetical protein N7495_006632 [Penicillium taxi]